MGDGKRFVDVLRDYQKVMYAETARDLEQYGIKGRLATGVVHAAVTVGTLALSTPAFPLFPIAVVGEYLKRNYDSPAQVL
jgi:hypothetical protein